MGVIPRLGLASPSPGLNIQFANVFIQCSPWWKMSWERQAVGSVLRPGQVSPVFHYKISAIGCDFQNDNEGPSIETCPS
ncbi:hypothetical protein S40293_11393 [Stachybotrys chartarum IBT 40293]|nr:hypothetical protein S40293_11393 [Stachybotrys chartarum IBT 40293]KFA81510.1 hypothetical protein S40288_10791 [Stachybotrys chartarum IBT 40288]